MQKNLEFYIVIPPIDAFSVGEKKLTPADPVKRIGNEPFYCANAGVSIMTRKDSLHRFYWFDEGLNKLRENGDFEWLCNLAKSGKYNNNTNPGTMVISNQVQQ